LGAPGDRKRWVLEAGHELVTKTHKLGEVGERTKRGHAVPPTNTLLSSRLFAMKSTHTSISSGTKIRTYNQSIEAEKITWHVPQLAEQGVWQFAPVKPLGQVQLYPGEQPPATQVPPFWQGEEPQTS
jgi:hypothetical protein